MKLKITKATVWLSMFSICLIFPVLLQGCGKKSEDIDIAGKTYRYTGEPFSNMEGDDFTISLCEDGTFSYYESAFSSYIGFGEWSVKDNTLTLTDDSEGGFDLQNSFQIDGTDLVFVENGSTNFTYIKVKDGERFVEVTDKDDLLMPDEAEPEFSDSI